ncbi:MAG: elongation factor P [Verrucomicrobiia bacterium Tous-C2TDCM]|jgi:elongation factor P|nr:MAG: elongation factor P [Verrucomicrobiae bacterium Tous-C2TDCM]
MAIVATQLKRGQCISYNNELGIVTGTEHRTPGKGNALVMATVRSFKTGKTKDIRFASSDKVEIVQSERQKLEYSYHDQVGYHFMDPSTYDTVTFQEEFIEDSKDLLIDGITVEVLFVDGKAVTIELPPSIELEVTESAPGVKGDTATAATKEATLQTGLRIQVPLFINPGDRIRVSSEDKKYVSRA